MAVNRSGAAKEPADTSTDESTVTPPVDPVTPPEEGTTPPPVDPGEGSGDDNGAPVDAEPGSALEAAREAAASIPHLNLDARTEG